MTGDTEHHGETIERLIVLWHKSGWLTNPKLADAFRRIPRTAFISQNLEEIAYKDAPLPIGFGQTISQPSTIIRMLSVLEVQSGHQILEIGAGCGYQAALLAHLCGSKGRVHSVEIIKDLVTLAQNNVARLPEEICSTIEFSHDDASALSSNNPVYDRIIAACACPQIPVGWQQAVKVGGIILAPVGDRKNQQLIKATRVDNDYFKTERLGYFRFVPLRGTLGFKDPS